MFPMPTIEGKLSFLIIPGSLSISTNIWRSCQVESNFCARVHLKVMDLDVTFFIDKLKKPSAAEKEFFYLQKATLGCSRRKRLLKFQNNYAKM